MSADKVIGVGFHKTGTTTLGECFRLLGFNHLSCSREAFVLFHSGKTDAVLELMERFDSFEDWPWPFLYREASARFPDSKLILTAGRDGETWFQSLAKHVRRGAGVGFKYRKYVYGYEDPTENKEAHIRKYLRHYREVRQFFSDKPDRFLEVCWEDGDGWRELCPFLGVEVGGLPFPHANRAPD